ncbi:MFS transporter [Jatrophihabitans sp. YIM 134969]
MTTTDHPAVAPATYRALFTTRGVPQLYGATLANTLGTSLQILALSVAVYASTGSALWSSVAFAAGFLPQLLGGAVLTSLADRWPARPVLVGGAVLRTTVVAALALTDLPPAVAITVVAAAAVVQPVPSATQSALVARLLTGELYVLGRSVFTVLGSAAQLAGLAVGGTVVAALGVPAAFGVSAGIQALGLVAVALLPATGAVAPTTARWHPRDTWRGNAGLLADSRIRRILLSWWLPVMLLVAAESLIVAYVGEQGRPASDVGLLLAAFPAGAAVGDLLVGRWLPARWRRRSVPWLLALVGVGLLPLAWHPPVAVAVACLAAASAGSAYQLGGQQAFLAAVPAERQGLAFGLVSTGIMGVQGLGPVLAGAVADVVGAGVTITALGVGILVVTAVLGRLPHPS